MLETIKTDLDLVDLFEKHRQTNTLRDLSYIPHCSFGTVFNFDDRVVVKFRQREAAEAEIVNASIYDTLGMQLPPHYTIALTQGSCDYFEAEPDVQSASHVVISPFVPGRTIEAVRKDVKSDPTKTNALQQKLCRQLLVPACIGQLLDPKEDNFILRESDEQAVLIDCEIGLHCAKEQKIAPGCVTALFQAMTDPACAYGSETVPDCHRHFGIFRNGFRPDQMDHYRQQCESIMDRLTTTPMPSLDCGGTKEILIARAATLKAFL